RVESRARDLDQAGIIRAAIQGETAQPRTVQHRLRRFLVFDPLYLSRETADRWMIFHVHGHGASSSVRGLDHACRVLNQRLKLLQLGLDCQDSAFESRQGYHASLHEWP